jgi:hypothetical protein
LVDSYKEFLSYEEIAETAEVLTWKEPSPNSTPLNLRYYSSPDINWAGLKPGSVISFTLKIHYIDANGIKRVARSEKIIRFIFVNNSKTNKYYFTVLESFRIKTDQSIIYFPENYRITIHH